VRWSWPKTIMYRKCFSVTISSITLTKHTLLSIHYKAYITKLTLQLQSIHYAKNQWNDWNCLVNKLWEDRGQENGNLPLKIETSRYHHPVITLSERFCPICTDSIENEVRFVCECPVYSDLRFSLFRTMSTEVPNFYHFNPENQYSSLMNCDVIQCSLAKTVYLMFKRRRSLLNATF